MTFASLSRSAALMLLCSLLTACGLTQAVSDGTVSATRAIFYKKIKVLRLDFEPRAAANADESQTPLATMVQVYQLKDRQKVDAAEYQKLLRDADSTLKEDIVASKSLLVMPKGSVTLNMPMNEDAKFVAVVGLFNRPDIKNNTWKLVLSRDDLDPDKPRAIQLNSTGLTLVPVKE
ncbi:type VI secretion system lipoprotein TssJ [Pantoea sp. Bo_2]|uniref:type VI secretion system lipoprotein TssJ n=1 Tax=unclassified Pantoea TaxID=2630326 RepID=UPI0012329562|nr:MULTISPECIES: type VI secretion system lipoprotein TssJ [unclassified Pantoea]KAA5935951.1 type VI secretion system lipoprotein TssJ [Pantoea sp. VH_3]KAA5944700.1 type VI secretion system lipoprotein TssJ [Pantoea sp. VH_25]KAA5975819.1 type VI secretion system lipoprotein TssJ [Pantoea sp. M_3]KAA6049850.1 type VI secretion system lipoprotein TssJ [Pantoea sp. FN_2b]KAA6054651.1 type VI secretion system lipoprotein TssJ [Pantoea sp. Bo_5]